MRGEKKLNLRTKRGIDKAIKRSKTITAVVDKAGRVTTDKPVSKELMKALGTLLRGTKI